jgi:hypothetical protein
MRATKTCSRNPPPGSKRAKLLSVLGEENTDGSLKLKIIVRSKSDANKVRCALNLFNSRPFSRMHTPQDYDTLIEAIKGSRKGTTVLHSQSMFL